MSIIQLYLDEIGYLFMDKSWMKDNVQLLMIAIAIDYDVGTYTFSSICGYGGTINYNN